MLSARQLIFDGNKTYHQVRAADESYARSEAETIGTLNRLGFDLANNYYGNLRFEN